MSIQEKLDWLEFIFIIVLPWAAFGIAIVWTSSINFKE